MHWAQKLEKFLHLNVAIWLQTTKFFFLMMLYGFWAAKHQINIL